MRNDQQIAIKLSDYSEPPFWIDTVELTFKLDPTQTRVMSRICFVPNQNRSEGPHPLRLDGRALRLIGARIDGKILEEDTILIDAEGLTIASDIVPQEGFIWEAEVEINPSANTALEGLYMSGGMYCTQCEAQGFRKITYYLDRPDVMARFHVTIEGNGHDTPCLLSNGNGISYEHDGRVPSALNRAIWEDPHPKPAYLFALVAGDLAVVEDRFVTRSGREVVLEIYVRHGDEGKCAYAMDALKRSMKWDEDVYGREYDLDIFMIVAVDDFNMGAMENKGLNIFNSKYVLASPETATDRDYELIEGIIAHEYFHNWTGNRITCRDWFQLCLKEGLTVFRDQQFSSDQRSEPVKRIDDVLMLRGRQFKEDAGPLAHPVRPEEYIEINNFYTATVYEKGAEVIRMLKLIVGDAGYAKALDLYFTRHDGQACTIEDWLRVFEDACDISLEPFKRWYQQSGTPRLKAKTTFRDGRLQLHLSQETPPTPNQPEKSPFVIPVLTGFLAPDGTEARSEELLVLDAAEKSFEFDGFAQEPHLSLLRGFSAPVIFDNAHSRQSKLFALAHDTDTFNRWQAGRDLVTEGLLAQVQGDKPDAELAETLGNLAQDKELDPAYRAFLLAIPSDDGLAQKCTDAGVPIDPQAIVQARKDWIRTLGNAPADWAKLNTELQLEGPYQPIAADAGKRALQARCLGILTEAQGTGLVRELFASADNMTTKMSAFQLLVAHDDAQEASERFYAQWRDDKLVIDKWFAVQVASAPSDKAVDIAQTLAQHEVFEWQNPNRFRSLIGGFAANHAGFHRADGAGYRFVAQWLAKLDPVNPQTTARMCGLFESWKRYDPARQNALKSAMETIRKNKDLSRDSQEILNKILSA